MRKKIMITVFCLLACLTANVNSACAMALAMQQTQDDKATPDSITSDTPEISDASYTSALAIENKNTYKGMKKSYSAGYVPHVTNKTATIVLPLIAKRRLAHDKMTVSLRLGEAENLPFIYKNYEKSFLLARHKIRNSKRKVSCYLVTFRLALQKKRYGGTYPVTLSVYAEDKSGNEINQDFTVYVTVSDTKQKKKKTSGSSAGKDPELAPKVLINSYKFSKQNVICGEKTTADLTLLNTSKSRAVKNMLVSITPDENIELLGKRDSFYIEQLRHGKTCHLSFPFRVKANAPYGQYNIGVTIEYSDSKGGTYTAQGSVKISARQRTQLEISPVQIPGQIRVGESVELQAQAMNLGRGTLYNVRALLEADGLQPSGAAFIGDIEAGTSMTGNMELVAEGLSGESLYGTAHGKVTFYYEDEMGNEKTQVQSFETSLLSPRSKDRENEPEDNQKQWWIIMAVILVILALAFTMFFFRKRMGDRKK